jgi:hypothetical protein
MTGNLINSGHEYAFISPLQRPDRLWAHADTYLILLVVFSPGIKRAGRETDVISFNAGVNNVE